MNLRELLTATKEISRYIEWELETLEDFHRYAHRFGGTPGGNVYKFALEDALLSRGMTLEQLRKDAA